MFLKRYDLLVKFLINYETVCLKQMYIILLNLDDNTAELAELMIIQQSLNGAHPHQSLVILLSVLTSNFIVSGVKS